MSEELDRMLVAQWQDAIHRRRVLQKYRRLIPHEPFIEASILAVNQQLDYLELMIQNKSLLVPVKRRRKREQTDILGANYWSEWYKMTVAMTFLGGRIFVKNMLSLITYSSKQE